MIRVEDVDSRYLRKTVALSIEQGAAMLSPLEVVRLLNAEKISFVLVGAHGLAGWMKKPRATQDVDVVIANRHVRKATRALLTAYPQLEAHEEEVVVRLRDRTSGDVVIDLIKQRELYRSAFQYTRPIALGKQACRVPTLEMALAMKFAAMISPNRPVEKSYQDAHDFIVIAKENPETDEDVLRELGELIYGGGGEALLEALRKARAGERLEL